MTEPHTAPHTAPSQEHACARAWAALTAAHARVSGLLTTALQESCGLTITDFEILLRLDAGHSASHSASHSAGHDAGRSAGQRIGELTGPVRLSQPALSRAVARLAGRGFLTRSGSPADARCVLVTLTPAGRDVLATAADVHAGVISEALLGRLRPDEQELLARVLARVADR